MRGWGESPASWLRGRRTMVRSVGIDAEGDGPDVGPRAKRTMPQASGLAFAFRVAWAVMWCELTSGPRRGPPGAWHRFQAEP